MQANSTSAAEPIRETKDHFVSSGKSITVEVFSPASAGRRPGIIVLHGAGGLLLDGPAIRRVARALAVSGSEAFVVHYFERTGNIYASGRELHDRFNAWRETVNDAVSFVAARPDVDPAKIGCFGYSLGAYLSLAQSAHDPRVGAVVELAGAIDAEHAGKVKHLAPTLILHGDQDRRVPFENAQRLEALLQRLHVPYEKKIYAGEGHVLSNASLMDAAARGVRFLHEHLR